MALFKVRRTIKPGVIPAGLTYGEMAVNIVDKILYVGGTAGDSIEIGGGSGNSIKWSNPSPTLATDIQGVAAGTTFNVGTDAITILEQILYPYQSVSFSALSLGSPFPTSTYELGQTAGNGVGIVTWASSTPDANWVANSAYISYSGFATGTLFSAGNPLADTASVTYPAFKSTTISPNTLTVSLTGQQTSGTNPVTTSASRRWWSRWYWGKSTNSALTDPFGLTNGSSALLTNASSASGVLTTTASSGYFYVFVHSNYTINTMTLGGFNVSLDTTTTASVTNAQGFSTTYKIYKSLNQLNDALSITVS